MADFHHKSAIAFGSSCNATFPGSRWHSAIGLLSVVGLLTRIVLGLVLLGMVLLGLVLGLAAVDGSIPEKLQAFPAIPSQPALHFGAASAARATPARDRLDYGKHRGAELVVSAVKFQTGYCSQCNHPVATDARNCPNCGVGFYGATPIMTQKKGMTMLRIGIIVVSGLLVMIVITGMIAVTTKMTRKPRVSAGTSLWTGGAGNGVPTENYSGGLYQKEGKRRWGHAQVPKTISGASEGGPSNLGYAQGVARPQQAHPQPGRPPQGQPQGQLPPGQLPPGQARPYPNRPAGQPPTGTPGGYPTGRPASLPLPAQGQLPPSQPSGQTPNGPIYGVPAGLPPQSQRPHRPNGR